MEDEEWEVDDEEEEEELEDEEAQFYGEVDEEESPRPPALLPDDASDGQEPGSPSLAIESDGIRHPGPMTRAFHAPFEPDVSDDPILGPIDPDGLALVALQGLNEVVQQKDEEIEDLRGRVERLEALARAALVG